MGQLIELVFESATKTRAAELLQDLATASRSEYALICDGKTILPDTSLNKLLSDIHSCAAMRFLSFAMPDIGMVSAVVVRVLKTAEDLFDIEVSLDLDDVEHLARKLLASALVVAAVLRASDLDEGVVRAADFEERVERD